MKIFGKELIGYQTPKFQVEIEKGRLKLFSKAIGETAAVYVDEEVAKSLGYRSLPVPPTFLFCLEMERVDPYDWMLELEIPLANVLHAGQPDGRAELPAMVQHRPALGLRHRRSGPGSFLC